MAIFRCTLTGIQYNQVTIQNVLHFNWPDFAGAEILVCQELRDGWCTIVAAAQVNSFGWRNVSVYRVGSGVAPTNLPIVVGGQDIGDPNNSMPTLSAKMRIHTAVAGRTGRGRIYVAGVRQAHWQFGQMTAAGQTVWNARVTALKNRYVGVGATGPMTLGVMPRSEDFTQFKSADDLTLTIIPGQQRRRNLGVGI